MSFKLTNKYGKFLDRMAADSMLSGHIQFKSLQYYKEPENKTNGKFDLEEGVTRSAINTQLELRRRAGSGKFKTILKGLRHRESRAELKSQQWFILCMSYEIDTEVEDSLAGNGYDTWLVFDDFSEFLKSIEFALSNMVLNSNSRALAVKCHSRRVCYDINKYQLSTLNLPFFKEEFFWFFVVLRGIEK